MYYKLNDNGEIAITSSIHEEGFIEAKEDIVPSYDGQKLLFKSQTETEEYKQAEATWNAQQNLNDLRRRRKVLLDAFDKWEKAVLRGREEESETVMNWYRDLRDLVPEAFADVPGKVRYYL